MFAPFYVTATNRRRPFEANIFEADSRETKIGKKTAHVKHTNIIIQSLPISQFILSAEAKFKAWTCIIQPAI